MTKDIRALVKKYVVEHRVMPPDALDFAVINIRPDTHEPSVLDVSIQLADPELAKQFLGGRTMKFSVYPPYPEEEIKTKCGEAARTIKRRIAVSEAGGVFTKERPIYEGGKRPESVKVELDVESKPKKKNRRKRKRKKSSSTSK